MTLEELRREAAHAAVERCVESGATIGLGTGKTTDLVTRRIGELLRAGELSDVRGIPTSERTARLAGEVGIPLLSLAEARPEITIDGTDEIDSEMNLIKGRGGALLREKIVAASSRDGLVVVADDSKSVESLGVGTLPVEVEPFGWETTFEALKSLGCEPELRLEDDEPFITDGGHYTVDCVFPSIPEPGALQTEIRDIPGALECGLFVGLARSAFIARESGVVEVMER